MVIKYSTKLSFLLATHSCIMFGSMESEQN